jgi:C-terminal processing protease CtpA/Prc
MGVSLMNVKKEDNGKFYYNTINSNLLHPKRNNYNGKIYVLINGGTFSASCLISSNLSGSGRAIFVGEETGGAFNGNVAGTLPIFTLPKSRLKLRFGGALIQPHYKSDNIGRGIMPDIEIKPTREDIISGNDAELTRVLDEIKKGK